MLSPLTIEGTELAVPIAVGMGFAIFNPQQTQGDAFLAQLGVNQGPVGTGDDARIGWRRFGKEALKQPIFAQVRRERPAQAGFLGTPEILGNGTVGDGATPSDYPIRQATLPFQTENFSYLAHG